MDPVHSLFHHTISFVLLEAFESNAKGGNTQISYSKYTRNGVVEEGTKKSQQGMSRALVRIDRLAITYS